MSVTRTVARTSILKPVVQSDGKTKLVEVGKIIRSDGSAAPISATTAVKGVIQSGVSINPGDAASTAPGAVVPVNKKNSYYMELTSHGTTSLIQASSIDEAWGIFANQNGIAAVSDLPVKITEFVP
jgi:hypothetical protein